jgi:peptidoglycan/xylan/chitin deacetylase (PgdA/CDA1 family)
MDHAHYAFLPTPSRAPIQWPDVARLAACIVVHVEHWEVVPPETAWRDPRFADAAGSFSPDYRAHSWREYGNRVGIFRILSLLDRLELPFTVALNASACRTYPALLDELLRRAPDIAAHGTHATRMLTSRMDADEERAVISGALDTIAAATGVRPEGWIGQDHGESQRTPTLLAELGLRYVFDWPNDDQPYLMQGGLVSLPNQAEWDDVQLLWHRRVPLARYGGLVTDAFRRLHAEGATSGRFFGLNIHPWLLGAPHRFQTLATTLTGLRDLPSVWWTGLDAVARRVRADPASFGAVS